MHNPSDNIIESNKLYEGESEPHDEKYVEKFQELLRDEPEPSTELLVSLETQSRGTLMRLRNVFNDIEANQPTSEKYKSVLTKINSILDA